MEYTPYTTTQPKFCHGQTVEFTHHNGNSMVGKITALETHYNYQTGVGYHIYEILREGNVRSWWIGERKIITVLN